jgi:hypothetical protein
MIKVFKLALVVSSPLIMKARMNGMSAKPKLDFYTPYKISLNPLGYSKQFV